MRTQLLPTTLIVFTALASSSSADVLVLDAAKDNTLYEDAGGALSNGAGEYIFSGKTAMSLLRRGLIQFDVAGSVPAGSTIESVRLILDMDMTIASDQDVSLHEVLADWGEGASDAPGMEGTGTAAAAGDATWLHTFYSSAFWTTAGGDFDPTASATTSVKTAGTYTWGTSAGLVADVQGWLDTPASNFGWILVHDDEVTVTTAKRYASREHSDASLRPRLEIGFTPAGGCGTTPYCAANPNSTGVSSRIFLSGSCSIMANNFNLTAQPVPNQPGIFFFGNNQLQVSFGNGFLCVGGGIVRLRPVVFGSGNVATLTANPNQLVAGTKNFQYWYRDPMGLGAGFNLSDGMAVTLVP